jgi:hypothetical protein
MRRKKRTKRGQNLRRKKIGSKHKNLVLTSFTLMCVQRLVQTLCRLCNEIFPVTTCKQLVRVKYSCSMFLLKNLAL